MSPRSLTAQDRSALIRLASSLPAGSPERKAILAGLKASTNRQAGAVFVGPGVVETPEIQKVLTFVEGAYGGFQRILLKPEGPTLNILNEGWVRGKAGPSVGGDFPTTAPGELRYDLLKARVSITVVFAKGGKIRVVLDQPKKPLSHGKEDTALNMEEVLYNGNSPDGAVRSLKIALRSLREWQSQFVD